MLFLCSKDLSIDFKLWCLILNKAEPNIVVALIGNISYRGDNFRSRHNTTSFARKMPLFSANTGTSHVSSADKQQPFILIVKICAQRLISSLLGCDSVIPAVPDKIPSCQVLRRLGLAWKKDFVFQHVRVWHLSMTWNKTTAIWKAKRVRNWQRQIGLTRFMNRLLSLASIIHLSI